MVLNPSFENYSSCPYGISDFNLCVDWSVPFINVTTDTCSTSDLYNSCAVEVPANIMGNEPARTGDGYAGIIAYESFSLIGCLSLFGSGWSRVWEKGRDEPANRTGVPLILAEGLELVK